MSEDKKNIQHMHKNTSIVTKAEEKIVADWVRESRAEDKKWLLKQNDEKQERLKIQGQVLDEKITQEQANTLIKNMHISEGEIYKQELAAFDKLPHAKEAEAILKREFIEILPDLQKLGYSKLFDNAKLKNFLASPLVFIAVLKVSFKEMINFEKELEFTNVVIKSNA